MLRVSLVTLTFGWWPQNRWEASARRHSRGGNWSPCGIEQSRNWCIASKLRLPSCVCQRCEWRVQTLALLAHRHRCQEESDSLAGNSSNFPIGWLGRRCSAVSFQRPCVPQQLNQQPEMILDQRYLLRLVLGLRSLQLCGSLTTCECRSSRKWHWLDPCHRSPSVLACTLCLRCCPDPSV